jgi:hypothetical protein
MQVVLRVTKKGWEGRKRGEEKQGRWGVVGIRIFFDGQGNGSPGWS